MNCRGAQIALLSFVTERSCWTGFRLADIIAPGQSIAQKSNSLPTNADAEHNKIRANLNKLDRRDQIGGHCSRTKLSNTRRQRNFSRGR